MTTPATAIHVLRDARESHAILLGSTRVFSVIECWQFGQRAGSVSMNSYAPRLPVTSAKSQSNGIIPL
jgi:hypothetical protein